jgi:hypothetical protein
VGEIRRRGEAEDPSNLLIMNLLIMSLFAVVDVGCYLRILSLLALVGVLITCYQTLKDEVYL